jgi:hypothetical protein
VESHKNINGEFQPRVVSSSNEEDLMDPADQKPASTQPSFPTTGPTSSFPPTQQPIHQPIVQRGLAPENESLSGEENENASTPIATVFKQTSELFSEVTLSMSQEVMEIDEVWTHFKGEKTNPFEMLQNDDKWEVLKEVGKRWYAEAVDGVDGVALIAFLVFII